MKNPTKFRTVSDVQYKSFKIKYDFTDPRDDIENLPEHLGFGEIKIPGAGWHACLLSEDSVPTHFWSDDDGWMSIPEPATFEEV
jgi:hypothetical protein